MLKPQMGIIQNTLPLSTIYCNIIWIVLYSNMLQHNQVPKLNDGPIASMNSHWADRMKYWKQG